MPTSCTTSAARLSSLSTAASNAAPVFHKRNRKHSFNLVRLALAWVLAMGYFLWPNVVPQVQAAVPNGFTISTIAVGPDNAGPASIAFAPGNRIYIAEKQGIVRVWQNGVVLNTPFINLSDEVNNYNERGLMGIAVDPNFPAQPYLYLYYTFDLDDNWWDGFTIRAARVERIAANPSNLNVASTAPGSRVVLMGNGYRRSGDDVLCTVANQPGVYLPDCLPAEGGSHVNGSLHFGPDGMLYVSIGDNSNSQITDPNAARAQNLDILLGKLLRISPVTGQGLPNNPFYNGDANANRSRVYGYGLRNPFSFTFSPSTGLPYIADVGWDSAEELNIGAGKNFGWPCYEGAGTQAAFINLASTQAMCAALVLSGTAQAPAYAFNHGVGSSIIGGAFYTGAAYPAQYQGALFIADYGQQWLRYITFDVNGVGTLHSFADGYGAPTQVTSGLDSNIYFSTFDGNSNSYAIRRVRYTANGNRPPIAQIQANPNNGPKPLSVSFSSAGSFDPDGQALTYEWDFGDGGISNDVNPVYTYTTRGNRVASLVVMDSLGELSDAAQVTIMVDNHVPTLVMNAPVAGASYRVGDVVNFSGTANDIEDGNISNRIQWTVQLHHGNHIHPNFVMHTGASGSFNVPDHGDNSWLEVCAVAFDLNDTSSGTLCRMLYPETSQYVFTTSPVALDISYDGVTMMGVLTATSIVNSSHQLSVPDVQAGYRFVGWSDGGARSRSLLIGAGTHVLTAQYEAIPTATAVPPTATATATATATGTALPNATATTSGPPATSAAPTLTLTPLPTSSGNLATATVAAIVTAIPDSTPGPSNLPTPVSTATMQVTIEPKSAKLYLPVIGN